MSDEDTAWPKGVITDPSFFPETDLAGRFSPRVVEPTAEEPAPVKNKPEGRVKYGDKPFIRDQAQKHPESVKQGPPIHSVFDLSKPDQLQALNELSSRVFEKGAIFVAMDRQFSNGGWHVFTIHSDLKYRPI